MSIPMRRREARTLGAMALSFWPILTCGAAHSAHADTAQALLKASMNRYAALATFQADCTVSVTASGQALGASERTIQISRPNHFRIVNKSNSMNCVSISDGTKMVEYMLGGSFPVQARPAPATIAEAKGIFLDNPTQTGSPLYRFFAGAAHYDDLVNSAKAVPAFGAPVTIASQPCKTVAFQSQGLFGTTEVAIGDSDGLVHRIVYHNEPLLLQMAKMLKSPEFLAQLKSAGKIDAQALAAAVPKSMLSTETYTKVTCSEPLNDAVFDTTPPAGQDVQQQPGEPSPPVPLGKPAPEITVKRVDGGSTTLASLRGRVVLIDFWATWCPPCRKGLPETDALYEAYGKSGLAVVTISDETRDKVGPYLKSNKLAFPAYLDQNGATNKAWHIEAIPTVAIIDRNGNLSAYIVGLRDKSEIMAALKHAGLAVK